MKKKNKWISQGEINQELSRSVIYSTSAIDAFLQQDRISILVASKGMGKTLLLRYKRQLLMDQLNKSVLFIPQRYMLDLPRLPTQLENKQITKHCEDVEFWKELWEISILFSVFLHCDIDNILDNASFNEMLVSKEMPTLISVELKGKINGKKSYRCYDPSEILSIILQQSIGMIYQLRDKLVVYRSIHASINKSIYCFIDSFDQALSVYFREQPMVWSAGQLGLMLASWNLNRTNSHLKVYVAIRQEAYSQYRGENRMTMQSSILQLSYSKSDLKNMLNVLCRYYEEFNSFEELLGFDIIRNDVAKRYESIFDYIYRYMVCTPRAIVLIGNAVSYAAEEIRSAEKQEEKEDIFRRVIVYTTDEIIRNYLFGEMTSFFISLISRDRIDYLFSLLKANVFSLSELEEIKCKYCEVYGNSDPIAEMINIGLIGFLVNDYFSQGKIIKFKKATDFVLNKSNFIPDSECYFIHPALMLSVIRVNANFTVLHEIIVGDEIPWKDEYCEKVIPEYSQLSTLIQKIEMSKNDAIDALNKAEKARKITLELLKKSSKRI